MNKQIEEMAKDLCRLNRECGTCPFAIRGIECNPKRNAKRAYDKGYRKESNVALEVIKKVEQILTVKIIGIEEDLFHGTAAHWDGIRRNCYEELLVELAELKKKYESEGADDENCQ